MKKAFTMIELIFVIVILGVLAAVAIPKLNATRADAYNTKILNNFNVLMEDLVSYNLKNGGFALIDTMNPNLQNFDTGKMSNVVLGENNFVKSSDGKICFDYLFQLEDKKVKFYTTYSNKQKLSNVCKTLINFLKDNGIDITTNKGQESIALRVGGDKPLF